MTNWYIFRHGKATWSTTGYGDQIMTAHLLPEARPAVERLANWLETNTDQPDFFAASPVPRCQETATIVSQLTEVPFVTDQRMTEFSGETYEELNGRVQEFIDEVADRHYQTVWLCSHGTVIAAFKHLLLEGTMTAEHELDYPSPAGLFVIRDGGSESYQFEI